MLASGSESLETTSFSSVTWDWVFGAFEAVFLGLEEVEAQAVNVIVSSIVNVSDNEKLIKDVFLSLFITTPYRFIILRITHFLPIVKVWNCRIFLI